jgi:hypothetical protein
MESKDYTIQKTYKVADIKHDDYILYNNTLYKIHLIKYKKCRNVYISVLYKCRCDLIESKNDFILFDIDNDCYEYLKYKKEITKIIFNIQNGTFVDYNIDDELITILDADCNLVSFKCRKEVFKCIRLNEEQIVKYIKYNDDYKIE